LVYTSLKWEGALECRAALLCLLGLDRCTRTQIYHEGWCFVLFLFLLFRVSCFDCWYAWKIVNLFAQKKAAALYTQAGDYQKTARFYYKKAEDTYYQANNWASYDDWRRARDQWDYFYSRNR